MGIGNAPKRSDFYSTSEYKSALRSYKSIKAYAKKADKAFERRFKARQKRKNRR